MLFSLGFGGGGDQLVPPVFGAGLAIMIALIHSAIINSILVTAYISVILTNSIVAVIASAGSNH